MWSSSLCVTRNILVSSANMKMELDTTYGKSLINIKNRKGPKTDPWWTPLVTGIVLDFLPLSTTCCVVSEMKFFIHFYN